MYDLVLINPGFEVERDRENFVFPQTIGHGRIPQFAVNLAPYVMRKGYSVKVLDFDAVSSSEEDRILEEHVPGARFVRISAMTAQVPHALSVAKRVRRLSPESKIIWGGVHASLLPEETVAHPLVDYVVIGEGEAPLASVLAEGHHHRIGTKKYKPDLTAGPMYLPPEELADPDYTVVDMQVYFKLHDGHRNAGVITSRGCSSNCSFCINTALHNKWRGFSAERAINLLRRVREDHQIDHIFILDEHFFGHRKRAVEIIKALVDIEASWEANMRIDILLSYNDEMMKLLKDSNMVRIRMGGESASDRMLKILRKGITRDNIVAALEKCLKWEILPIMSFMCDLPDELPHEKEATFELAEYCRREGAMVFGPQRFRPYPGSEEYDKLVARGLEIPRSLDEWAECDMFTTLR